MTYMDLLDHTMPICEALNRLRLEDEISYAAYSELWDLVSALEAAWK